MDKKEIKKLNSIMDYQSYKIRELNSRINNLEGKVEELSKLAFNAQIRKLLNKLLEYLLNAYYKSCMNFNKETNKLSFQRVPDILNKENSQNLLKALNKILEIIFTKTKEIDYSLHFVSKDAMKFKSYKQEIVVFNNYEEFCQYFGISQYKDIIIKIIPEYYLTTINNSNFESKISYLLSKFYK